MALHSLLPKTKREKGYLATGLLALGLVVGGILGYNALEQRYPQIMRRLWGRISVADCPSQERTRIDLKKDNIALEEIIAQTIFTTYSPGNSFNAGFMYLTPTDTSRLEEGEIVFLPGQTENRICTAKQSNGLIPVFVGDEGEGGYVTRVEVGLPPAEVLGQYYEGKKLSELKSFASLLNNDGSLPDPRTREQKLRMIFANAARTLKDLHLDYVFAPVLDTVRDVNSTENIMSAQDRAYSSNADTVIALARMYIEAMHAQGIRVIGKHYLGTGYTKVDPHRGLPTLDGVTASELATATKPFRALASSLDGIMVTHILAPGQQKPDSVSRDAYAFIRQQLGFKGIIITDDLYMGAIEDMYSEAERKWIVAASLDALDAGADAVILKYHQDVEEVTSAIAERMKKDSAFKHKLMEKVERLLKFKGLQAGSTQSIDQLLSGQQSREGITWVKRRLKGGETFLGLIAEEDPHIAGYNRRREPIIKDPVQYQKLLDEFKRMNGISPRQMRRGESYYLPDLNKDGIISHHTAEEPATVLPPMRRARFSSGQSLPWYLAGELGEQIIGSHGSLLPITTGPLQRYTQQFLDDNPAAGNLRRLRADRDYRFRDWNRNGRIDFRDPMEVLRGYGRR